MNIIPKFRGARAMFVVAAVAALFVGWYLVSPLFIDREIDEDFPNVAADASMDEAMLLEAQPELLASGSFVDADAIHKGKGSAAIYRLDDGRLVLRLEKFEVTNGPDLFVWLSSAGKGADADAIKASRTVELEPLKGNIGNQNYVLPADIDLDDLQSVVIWCRAFGVLFSQAVIDSV